MKKEIHQNYKTASYFIFGQVVLGLIYDIIYFHEVTESWLRIFAHIILSPGITIVIGLIVRQGFNWVKYFLLISSILILADEAISFKKEFLFSFNIVLNILGWIMTFYAIYLLFKIPQSQETVNMEENKKQSL